MFGTTLVATLAVAPPVTAVGVMSSGDAQPVLQRLALASAGGRTALWSQVRLDGSAGDVGVVLPIPDGTAVDWASRAFFEGLEVCTAPRILPPEGAPQVCPGDDPEPLAHVAGDLLGAATLEPNEAVILDDAPAVAAWAQARGLTLSPGLSVALQTAGVSRFFVASFSAPAGLSLTKPLRVVVPGGPPTFPLVLSQAGAQPMDVVLWAVGEGRAALDGTPLTLETTDLVFDVGNVSSNYPDLLAAALGSQGSHVLQMASHEALRDTVSATPDGPAIESFIRTYFDRAALFGETVGAPEDCVTAAAVVLGQSSRVGTTCPRTSLGVAGGAAPCAADVVDTGEVDPGLLRCGPLPDDLAVLLSDSVPGSVWVTRVAARIPAGAVGGDEDVTFPGGNRLDPVVAATGVDLSGCGGSGQGGGGSGTGAGTGSGSPSGAGPSAGSGSGTTVDVPIYAYDGCACAGSYIVVGYDEVAEEEAPDAYYVDEGDGCSSDGRETYASDEYATSTPDDCAGESYDAGDSYYDDGCGCDSSDVDSAGDGCSCDAGDSGAADSCSCDGIDATGDGCGGEDCSVRTDRKRRPINRLVYVALAIAIPLRRLSRPRRAVKASGARPGAPPSSA